VPVGLDALLVPAAQEFRGAVNHQINAKCQRILVDGRPKRIISHNDGSGFFRDRCNSLQINDFKRGIRVRFQVYHLAPFGNFLFKLLMTLCFTELYIYIQPRQKFQKHLLVPP